MSERAARGLLLSLARRARGGLLVIEEGGRTHTFGDPSGDLRARVTIHSPRAWRAFLGGSLGMGRAYADGLWDADDLVAFVRICARSIAPLDRARGRLWPLLWPLQAGGESLRRTGALRARRNAAAHYDLGNDLFRLFLDPTLTYSSAVFPHPGATLEDAQREKLDRACRKLGLRPEHRLLEIGSGWGSLALHAASRYGCEVVTTTLAAEQHALASERVREAGLDERVSVLMEDYRGLRGRFDRLVSIEMIEAVGWRHLDDYFRACSRLLAPDGSMVLQAILIDDRLYEGEKRMRSFANTVVFPGGCLASVASITDSLARVTDLRLAGHEDITPHYAETLRRWRRRFLASRRRALALGYEEGFLRMWELYLAYSEAGFRERRTRVAQMLLAKPLATPEAGAHQIDQRGGSARGELAERQHAARADDVVAVLERLDDPARPLAGRELAS